MDHAGLCKTTEMVKTDDQEAATMTLAIDLEEEVEQNMIDLAGNVTTHPTFHWLEGKGASEVALPTLVVVIPLMVKHATEGYNGMDDDEVDDFE